MLNSRWATARCWASRRDASSNRPRRPGRSRLRQTGRPAALSTGYAPPSASGRKRRRGRPCSWRGLHRLPQRDLRRGGRRGKLRPGRAPCSGVAPIAALTAWAALTAPSNVSAWPATTGRSSAEGPRRNAAQGVAGVLKGLGERPVVGMRLVVLHRGREGVVKPLVELGGPVGARYVRTPSSHSRSVSWRAKGVRMRAYSTVCFTGSSFRAPILASTSPFTRFTSSTCVATGLSLPNHSFLVSLASW